MRSPAAYTPGKTVRRSAPVTTSPFLQSEQSPPIRRMSRLSEHALRPVAVNSISEKSCIGRPSPSFLTRVICSGGFAFSSPLRDLLVFDLSSTYWADWTSVSNNNLTPAACKSFCNSNPMSRSIPTLAKDVGMSFARMIIVTRADRAAKILANSTAMIPPPTMATLRGKKASCLMESESKTRSVCGGFGSYMSPRQDSRTAREPVARSTL
mmetsp:Transcript_89604/g.164473  ORF Transcript_89604/g.164473 Transcript_89604/m.164473 type:complete len:210 (+) Transcript_89604:895-1524(+)